MRVTFVMGLFASALLAQRPPGRLTAPTWTEVDSGVPRSPAGIRAVVPDPSSPSTLYAVAYGSVGYGWGNLFKSTDGGGHWSMAGGVSNVNAVVVDPRDSSTLYAVAHGTVLKSTDAGLRWRGSSAGFAGAVSLAIDPKDSSTLYATGNGAVFKTTDAGASWQSKVTPRYCCGGQIAIDPSRPSTIYINNGEGVIKSTDGGDTWQSLVVTEGGCSCPVAVDPAHPGTVYAVYLSTATRQWNLYKSGDAGATWSIANNGLPPMSYVTSIAIDATTGTVYASYLVGDPTGGVAKSTDGGATWSTAGLPKDSPSVYSVALTGANPSTLFAGYFDLATGRGGVYRNAPGGAGWADASTGLEQVNIHALAIDPASRDTVYAGVSDGVSKSADSGGTWSTIHFPSPGPGTAFVPSVLVDPNDSNVVYASVGATGGCINSDHVLRKSTDAGATWADLPLSYCFFGGAVPLAMDRSDSRTLYAAPEDEADCGTPIDTSNDAGATWSTNYFNGYVTALVIDPSNTSILYGGTAGWPRGVLRSTDNGTTWAATALKDVDVSALALDPGNSNILYAAAAAPYPDGTPAVFKSTDAGASWSPINAGLEAVLAARSPVTALAVDPKLSVLYLGTSGGGVFQSIDGGASWAALNDGLPNLDVRALAVSADGSGTVFAGTAGGVFRSSGNARARTFRR